MSETESPRAEVVLTEAEWEALESCRSNGSLDHAFDPEPTIAAVERILTDRLAAVQAERDHHKARAEVVLSEAEGLRLPIRQTLVREWRDDYSVASIVDALVSVAEVWLADRLAAERDKWRQDWEDADARQITAAAERDDLRARLLAVEELRDSYYAWDGDPESEFASSPRQRAQLDAALATDAEGER